MNPSLRKLFRKQVPSTAAIDAFIADTTFPLVDGTDVTFVYRGYADAVFLRCWISGLDAAQPLQQLEQTDLWAVTIELPECSRIEYKYEVVNGDRRQLVVDSLNGILAHDPFGANSVCQGYNYQRPAWTLHDPAARAGSIEAKRIDCKAFHEARDIQIYLPARFKRKRRYPLLIVHDGADYLRYADLRIVLDNLIYRLEIPAMIVALTQSSDRLREYAGDDQHADFLAMDLLPALTRWYPLIDGSSRPRRHGREFRRRRIAARGMAPPRALRPFVIAIGVLRVQRPRPPPTRSRIRPGRSVHERVSRRARPPGRKDLHELRHL